MTYIRSLDYLFGLLLGWPPLKTIVSLVERIRTCSQSMIRREFHPTSDALGSAQHHSPTNDHQP
jgi:hypothetical protein